MCNKKVFMFIFKRYKTKSSFFNHHSFFYFNLQKLQHHFTSEKYMFRFFCVNIHLYLYNYISELLPKTKSFKKIRPLSELK